MNNGGMLLAMTIIIWIIALAIPSPKKYRKKRNNQTKKTNNSNVLFDSTQQKGKSQEAKEIEKSIRELKKQRQELEKERELLKAQQVIAEHEDFKKQLEYEKEENKRIAEQIRFRAEMNRINGYQFEAYVAEWLSNNGWLDLEVTKASGDYGADIIGYSPDGKRYAIQCKKLKGLTGIRAIQEVNAARMHYSCAGAAVVSTGEYTAAARQLAEECGVLLMNITYSDVSAETTLPNC